MDIAEFEKRVKPSAKRSRLEPFRAQIFELKAKGYADWQVRDWLAENGLEVSRQAVQQFIKSRDGSTSPASMPSANTVSASAAPVVSSAPPVVPEADEASPADDLAGLDKKQRREKLADKFIGEEAAPKNSLASRFLNQEKIK